MSITTDVSICNMALFYVGASPITSLTAETTDRAKLCNQIYAPTRNSLLQEHKWNFGMTRVALSLLVSVPINTWAYQFQMPQDCVQIHETYPVDTPYEIEGTLLLTNAGSIAIRYMRRVTDPALFSEKFRSALEYKLASLMAIPLTGDLKKAQLYDALFNQTMGIGKALDSQADPVLEYRCDNILEARW